MTFFGAADAEPGITARAQTAQSRAKARASIPGVSAAARRDLNSARETIGSRRTTGRQPVLAMILDTVKEAQRALSARGGGRPQRVPAPKQEVARSSRTPLSGKLTAGDHAYSSSGGTSVARSASAGSRYRVARQSFSSLNSQRFATR